MNDAREQEKRYEARVLAKQTADPRRDQCGEQPHIGAMTGGLGGRSSIRARIDRALHEAEQVMQRAQAAHRAKGIIDAHPEFAELLDALNEF